MDPRDGEAMIAPAADQVEPLDAGEPNEAPSSIQGVDLEDGTLKEAPPKNQRALVAVGGGILLIIAVALIFMVTTSSEPSNSTINLVVRNQSRSSSNSDSIASITGHEVPTPVVSAEAAATRRNHRIIRAAVVGVCGLILVSVVTMVIISMFFPQLLHPKPAVVVVPEEIAPPPARSVYEWCQDLFPARVDFAMAFFVGLALAVVLATLYPFPSSWLAISVGLRLLGLAVLAVVAGLFLPPQYVIVSVIICLSFLIGRWATWKEVQILTDSTPSLTESMQDSMQDSTMFTSGITKPAPPGIQVRLTNLLIACVLAAYAVYTLVRLPATTAWEPYLMGPLLSGALAAALSIVLVRRPLTGFLEYLYLVMGIGGALGFSWYFNTFVVVELAVVVAIWLFCYGASTTKMWI